jgi:hypothetical protein
MRQSVSQPSRKRVNDNAFPSASWRADCLLSADQLAPERKRSDRALVYLQMARLENTKRKMAHWLFLAKATVALAHLND